LTNRESFNGIDTWIEALQKTVVHEQVLTLVGNKTDLEHEYVIYNALLFIEGKLVRRRQRI
jgi:hypothetical protein